jgi:hypothetical protein
MVLERMGPALWKAVEAKRSHVGDLMGRRNVVACGVGFKESQGKISKEPCIVVSVTRKVPQAQLSPQDLVPQQVGAVRTDVQEVGMFRAWQSDPKDRFRPAIGGVSCGHHQVSAGTLGCMVQRAGERFILSNNHVLANTNKGARGDPVIQPGRYDGGTLADQIAVLEEWIPLQSETVASDCEVANAAVTLLNAAAQAIGSDSRLTAVKKQAAENTVDCALARPTSSDMAWPNILRIGLPRGVRVGTLGMAIQKTGRTTGHTTGTITQVDVTVQVDYDGKKANFVDQFMATGMSQGGDSGSAVLDMEGYVVGLLFAGSDVATLINPIKPVLNALNVQLVTG